MDIRHFYREAGDRNAPPLILLHGNGEDSTYFRHQIPALAAHFHVLAPDTRGHGQTPRGNAPFTIRQFSEDLQGFMDDHGMESAHILGFSDGGNIALIFALTNPERVRKLILNGANLDPSGMKRAIQAPIEAAYARALTDPSPAGQKEAEMLGLMVNDPRIDPASLAAIRSDTLVIAGTHDMVKTSHTRRIAAAIPRARLCLLDGGHFVAARHPDAFNQTILPFLLDT